MKTMRTMVAMLAVLAAMASCSKDPGEGGGTNLPEDVGAVMVSVSYPADVTTRAVGDKLKNNDPMKMTSADFFFTDDTGLITRHVGVGNENGSVQFTVLEVESGEALIKNMTTESTKCHILANYTTDRAADQIVDVDLADGTTNIASVLDNIMTLNDINDDEGSVANLPLYGVGNVKFEEEDGKAVSGTSNSGMKFGGIVDVTLHSLATRLQIGKISTAPWFQTLSGIQGGKVYDEDTKTWYIPGTNAADIQRTVEVVEFEVEGIYINYFYGEEVLDPATDKGPTGAILDGEQHQGYYQSDSPHYDFPVYGYRVFDEPAAPGNVAEGMPLSLLPDPDADDPESRVWAYNLLPGTVPHIVVRFSKIVIKDSNDQIEDEDPDDPSDDILEEITAGDKDYFITVKGFNDAGKVAIDKFLADNLYTLPDLVFNYTDLSETPEDNSLNVQVNVTMLPWKENIISWNKD